MKIGSNVEAYDEMGYRLFTTKSELDKAIHTIEGLLKGIGLDNKLNEDEANEILNW
jgi:hypothetical protein